ncbi:MAG: YtxH domain-containing protein [Actinobacteria bacterium]|nr:YtxH domain-containing protein [Actinomycetota bacterium]
MNEKNKDRYYHKPKRSGIGFFEIFAITLAAAAAGVIMGLLFAPQSGLKTRDIVNKKTKELLDRCSFVLLEARVMGEEILEKSIEKAEKVSSKVKKNK